MSCTQKLVLLISFTLLFYGWRLGVELINQALKASVLILHTNNLIVIIIIWRKYSAHSAPWFFSEALKTE